MGEWDEFDKEFGGENLTKQIEDARKREKDFEPLPAGQYTVKLKTLELKKSKGGKPMVSIAMKVVEGEHKNRLLFMNRVIGGTKNDGNMISGMETWLVSLEAEDENGELIVPLFKSYSQFADLLLDIKEAVDDMDMTYTVEYDDNAFNSIDKVKAAD